jgi:hypothetical protein
MTEPGIPSNWTELYSAMMVLASAVAGVAWGLKLEHKIDREIIRIDGHEKILQKMDEILDKGILPLTEERLKNFAIQVERVEIQMDKVDKKLDAILERPILERRKYERLP